MSRFGSSQATSKIFVAGQLGMAGGAILRQLEARKAAGEPLTLITRSSAELNLTDQAAVRAFMQSERPDQVILAAAKVTGFTGRITTDPSKPDRTLRKLMDVSRLANMGWEASIGLEQGVAETYQWYLKNVEGLRTW